MIRAWNLCTPDRPKPVGNSPRALMDAATRRSGLSDFGDEDFVEGLTVFIEALNRGNGMHAFGRFYSRQLMVAMLVHRLKLTELLADSPEIAAERIKKPLFVLGLPRSGTTVLFNLLAQDPTHRFMRNWEAFIAQVPPKGHYTDETDPRRRQAKWMLRFQKHLMPDIDRAHVFRSDGPEECTPVLMQGFATQAFAGGFDVPVYSEWLNEADHDPTYRHHRRALQALQWKYPGERWLLKSPDHLAAVDAILRAYPDAHFVHIHRDPVKAVASWASLNLVYRGVYYRRIDARELGRQVLGRLASDMERYLAARAALAPDRFYDLDYREFLNDPITAIRKMYDRFGFVLSDEAEGRMRAYLSDNPKNKHGVHKYRPEDFGLQETAIRGRFADYIDSQDL